MKQNAYARLFIPGLMVLGLVLINCGGPGENSPETMVAQLIDIFNKRLPGTTFKTELEKCIVKPAGNNRYWITFKNSSITTDLVSILKSVNKETSSEPEDFSSVLDTVHIDEIVFLYGPRERYLNVQSTNGITINHEFSPFEGKQQIPNLGELKVEKVGVSIGNLPNLGIDISGLVKHNKNDRKEVKGTSSKKEDINPLDIIMENVKIEVNYTRNHRENFSVLLETENIALKAGIDNPYLTLFFSGKSVSPSDFNREINKILQKGMKVLGLSIQSGKTKFSLKRKDYQWDIGLVDNVSFASFLEPDETGEFFKLGYELSIKDFRLVFPLKPEIEQLTNVKEFRFVFSMEHLSPQAILGLINFINTATERWDMTDSAKAQEVMFHGMQFLFAIINSQPVMKFEISPFKHSLGELEAKAELRLTLASLLSQPDAKISVDVLRIDEILKKLQETLVFSPDTFKSISETVTKFFVRKENGDASMNIEFKSHQPGKFFFNGQPKTIDPTRILELMNKRLPRTFPRKNTGLKD